MMRAILTSLAFLPVALMFSSSTAQDVSFNADIRPILAERCLECHGPDAEKREAELRLDIGEVAKKSVLVAGKPEKSELLRRLTSKDPDEVMPPPGSRKPLTAKQIETIRRWIQQGARYEGHWAYEPIGKPTPLEASDKLTTDIDRFLWAALNERGLKLSPPISRQQWIRRVTFDLTGLPPTWDEVVSFETDESENAYAKVVDRLLKSPRYGERWGRHWLDIARYADTLGGAAIGFTKFPFSYTYRDYVVRALNEDIPYDRFVTEQLAADQLGLPDNDPALAALGFLTVGMQFRNPHDTIDDQIDVVTRGLLGLTVACARCHDHKYDAIPTTDYYSLYATLASSQSPATLPLVGTPEDTEHFRVYRKELLKRQRLRASMAREQSVVMRSRLRMQVGLYLRELAKGGPEQDLSASFLSFRTDDIRPLVLNRWRDYMKKMPEDDPVFGLWVKLTKLQGEGFSKPCAELVDALAKENGDPKKFAPRNKLASNSPKWNPLVLAEFGQRKPKSLLEAADAYGAVFATANREWMIALLEATLEADANGKVIPDESEKHVILNSPVNRQLRRHLFESGTPIGMTEEESVTQLNRPVRDNVRGRSNAIHDWHLNSPGSPPRAMSLAEKERPGDFFVFRRGNAIDRGEVVAARFLTALSASDANPFADGKRRLGLAKAIVDPANPLTRRVVANWVWRHHFGRGLVRTPDDFGTRGQPPTHPQLLDYLATKLLEDGWSLKKLHRRIVLTDAYRQGSVEDDKSRRVDPDNKLLWRMPRRRLELEAMRDAMLAASGELDEKIGGRPFDLLSNPVVPRRSIYAFINRDIVHNLASTFDAANPNACTAKRPETTVPQQTLFALNSKFIQDRAAVMTKLKVFTEAKSDLARVELLYQRTFSRLPTDDEVQLALRYVQSQSEKSKTTPWQRLAHVLLAANEFVFVD